MWPLLWGAACGAQDVALFGELGLVNCPDCRAVVARAEILGKPAAS
jgi:hypothetical protein